MIWLLLALAAALSLRIVVAWWDARADTRHAHQLTRKTQP